MQRKLTALVFDMDNVLCTYDFDMRMRLLSEASGLSVEIIKARIWGSGLEDEAKTGKINEVEYMAQVSSALEMDMSDAQWVGIRQQSMTSNNVLLDHIAALKSAYSVHVLSNNVEIIKSHITETFPEMCSVFGENIHFSYEFNAAKPAAEFYTKFANHIGVQPEEIYFVDDLKHNIEGAEKVGILSHFFQSNEGLFAHMEEVLT